MKTARGARFDPVFLYLQVKRKPLIVLEWLFPLGMAVQGMSWMTGNNPFDSAPNFAQMASVMSENAWGIVFLAFGLLTFMLQTPRTINLRRVALVVNALVYLTIGASFFLSIPLIALAWPVVVQGLIALVVLVELR